MHASSFFAKRQVQRRPSFEYRCVVLEGGGFGENVVSWRGDSFIGFEAMFPGGGSGDTA